MKLVALVLSGALGLVTTERALADDGKPVPPRTEAPPSAPYPLENTTPLALALEFVGSASVFVVSQLTSDPAFRCGWCATNAFDRSVRRALVVDDSRAAATASHVLSIGVTPAIAFAGSIVPAFSHGQVSYVAEDAVLFMNAGMLSLGVTDVAKKLADRRRPGFAYGRKDELEYSESPNEEFLSFYSGDTALAFALASSGATTAFLRGYPTAPYVAVGGGAAALGAGILRISADMHWATDVITGAVAGTAIGFGMPYLLHGRDQNALRVAVAPSLTSDHAMLLAAGEF